MGFLEDEQLTCSLNKLFKNLSMALVLQRRDSSAHPVSGQLEDVPSLLREPVPRKLQDALSQQGYWPGQTVEGQEQMEADTCRWGPGTGGVWTK